MTEPLVSVVITAFNHERYIGEAVRSALSQTYQHREVIVVNDGSTDSTAAVLSDFGSAIRVITQRNTGVAGSRNRGVSEANGAYIALMDGDDRWHERKLERQVDGARAFPDAGLIVCDGFHFDGQQRSSELLPTTIPGAVRQDQPFVKALVLEHLVRANFISTTTQVMIPREVLDAVGVSDPAFRVASDYDLYLRIAARYPLLFVKEKLADWRYLPSSASGPSALRQFTWAKDMVAVLKKHARSSDTRLAALAAGAATTRARECARFAYYKGTDGERRWAVGFLTELLAVTRDPVVAAYAGALLVPPSVRSFVSSRLGSRRSPADAAKAQRG